ncbi:MAG: ABC transporter permease subunit [Armatimonadota bacterium]|nr:ABC transporter permease subunit [Armatimonadota bacterium]MDR7475142.1 ABC transporter permease subunit [Armatimonadota bacterium]MDR7539647.1 ABC transporter permease subunit [Armatimonadota bacterium]
MRRAGALVALLALWEAATRLGAVSPLLAPPPTRVATVLLGLMASGRLWPHFAVTMLEAGGGLILGVGVGAVLGLAAALLPPLADLLQPAMTLLNAVPRVILAPLFVIWLGIGLASKVALSFLLVAVTAFFAVYSGIREVDARLVDRVRTLGGNGLHLLCEVYLPSVAAWFLGSLKVAVGFAFTGAVVGEFVASSRGLGYLLSFAQSTYNAALTIALIALVVVVTFSIFVAFERLERWVFRWKRGHPVAEPLRALPDRQASAGLAGIGEEGVQPSGPPVN